MNSRKALRYHLAYVLLHGVLHSIAEQDVHIIRRWDEILCKI